MDPIIKHSFKLKISNALWQTQDVRRGCHQHWPAQPLSKHFDCFKIRIPLLLFVHKVFTRNQIITKGSAPLLQNKQTLSSKNKQEHSSIAELPMTLAQLVLSGKLWSRHPVNEILHQNLDLKRMTVMLFWNHNKEVHLRSENLSKYEYAQAFHEGDMMYRTVRTKAADVETSREDSNDLGGGFPGCFSKCLGHSWEQNPVY